VVLAFALSVSYVMHTRALAP